MTSVSVIVPAFEAEDSIRRAVCSALAQTHEDVEVIAVDDASNDGTGEVLASIGDARLRTIRFEENRGPSAARNAGIDAARGEWIALLDADDWWEPERLEHLLTLAAKTGAEMVADDQRLYAEGSSRPYSTRFKASGFRLEAAREIGLAEYLERSLGILQPIINRRFLLERHNLLFDEERRYGEDFLLFAECLLQGARLVLVPEAYYNCSISSGSLTGSRARIMAGMRDIYAELRGRTEVQAAGLDKVLACKIKEADESLAYSRVVDAFKQGEWGAAFRALVSTPRFPLLAVQRLPRTVRYRLRSRLSVDKSVRGYDR